MPGRLVARQERKIAYPCRSLLRRLGGKGGEEGSSLVDLLVRHQTQDLTATLDARGITRGEGTGIPSVGSDVIEWQANPLLIEESQVGVRARHTLPPGKPQPSGRFCVIEFE